MAVLLQSLQNIKQQQKGETPLFILESIKRWGISHMRPDQRLASLPCKAILIFQAPLRDWHTSNFSPPHPPICHPETNFNVVISQSRPLLYNPISITIPPSPRCCTEPGGFQPWSLWVRRIPHCDKRGPRPTSLFTIGVWRMRRRGGQCLESDVLKRACSTFVRLFAEDAEVEKSVQGNGTPH